MNPIKRIIMLGVNCKGSPYEVRISYAPQAPLFDYINNAHLLIEQKDRSPAWKACNDRDTG